MDVRRAAMVSRTSCNDLSKVYHDLSKVRSGSGRSSSTTRPAGATVLGVASPTNAGWLRSHGVVPVAYGDGLEDRLRAAAPHGVDAFVDLFGPEYVRLAARLGVPSTRIDTVVVSDAAAELGVRMEGAAALTFDEAHVALRELAGALATGTLEMPIAATYPLDDVVAAFEDLEGRHSFGKIVLLP